MKPGRLSVREAGAGSFLIATVWEDDRPAAMEADARLIAAAPCLLAACRAALAYLEPFQEYITAGEPLGLLDQLRAAVARAGGEGWRSEP